MVLENPALSSRDISSSDRGPDLSPSAMSGKAYHGIPHQGAGAAAPAGRVRVRRRADRYSPSARRVPRQRSRPVTPLADRLAPFIASSLEPVTNCPTRIGAGEHGHKRGAIPSSANLSACAGLSARLTIWRHSPVSTMTFKTTLVKSPKNPFQSPGTPSAARRMTYSSSSPHQPDFGSAAMTASDEATHPKMPPCALIMRSPIS